jgi:hemerythrin
MTTGVPEIDAQHKELLNRFNEFVEALLTGKGREEAGKTLDFLQFYAQWHFQREEKCMDEYRCPVAAANRAAHRQFLERFGQLYEQYQDSDVNPEVMYNTFWELQDWIIKHIKRVDTQLVSCVNGHSL